MSIFTNVKEGFKKSTKAAHELSKETHEAHTAPHPGMTELKEAKGLVEKGKVVVESIKESAADQKVVQKQMQHDAQTLKGTKETLEKSRH